MLCAPALLVVEAVAAKGRVAGLGGDPDDDVPIITGGGQSFAWDSSRQKLVGWCVQEGIKEVLFGDHRTTLTAWVCLERVARYSTFLSSPSLSTCQSYMRSARAWKYDLVVLLLSVMVQDRGCFRSGRRTLTFESPPAVARRPLPDGSKWAE